MRDMFFRLMMAALLVAVVTSARAEEAAQTSQWVLTVPRGSSIWNPGVYTTAERCDRARRAFTRSTGWPAKCAELMSP